MQIFLSRPTWVSEEFEEGLKIFLMSLDNMGIKPRTLGTTDYPSKAPLDEVLEIMDECQGAIILGYPQIVINSGQVKEDVIQDELILGTEWNHVEASLAYARGMPILIIHHHNVSRGIFERGVMNAFNHSIDMTQPSWCMEAALNGAINKWKEHCESGSSNFSAKVTVDSDKPTCPNCSTPSKPIYLSKLPAMMRIASWKCPMCDYLKQ